MSTGQYTGRGLAWNMDTDPDVTTTSKTPSEPDISTTKRQRKYHSKAARFLKGDFKLFKAKPNERYSKNSKNQDCTTQDSVVKGNPEDEDPSCSDQVQYIGKDEGESFLNNSGDAQWNSQSIDNIFQVTQAIEDSTITRPSLKYSRAFGNQSVGSKSSHKQDMSIEDIDDEFSEDCTLSKVKARTKPSKY